MYPGLIDTGMFTGVSHSNDWLTPKLSPQDVSLKMLQILEKKENQDVHLPFYSRFVPYLRLLPLEVNDLVHELLGANKDLAGFKHSVSEKKLKTVKVEKKEL